MLDGLPLSLAEFFALPEGPEDPVFFAAAELTEIAGKLAGHGGGSGGGPGGSGVSGAGLISYRQVGCHPGRALHFEYSTTKGVPGR